MKGSPKIAVNKYMAMFEPFALGAVFAVMALKYARDDKLLDAFADAAVALMWFLIYFDRAKAKPLQEK